jgi:hypothetical protein
VVTASKRRPRLTRLAGEPERDEASEAVLTFGMPLAELYAVVSRSRRSEPHPRYNSLPPTASSAFYRRE